MINLKSCKSQIEILEKLILLSKNWPNDSKVGCKSPYNLVQFIKTKGDFEKELEQFEGDFEIDENSEL